MASLIATRVFSLLSVGRLQHIVDESNQIPSTFPLVDGQYDLSQFGQSGASSMFIFSQIVF
jgi:hypothetical protein